MKTKLILELQRFQHEIETTKLMHTYPSIESIDRLWGCLIQAIQSPEMSAKDKSDVLQLEIIIKWDFLDYEKEDFDWSKISWDEIHLESSILIGSLDT